MLKRYVILLTVLTLLCTLTPSALADYASWSSAVREHCYVHNITCSFTSTYTVENIEGISYYSEAHHKVIVSRDFECIYCLSSGYAPEYITFYQEVLVPHSVIFNTPTEHIEGTNLHKRRHECTVCGEFETTYICDGPPCYVSLSFPEENDTH